MKRSRENWTRKGVLSSLVALGAALLLGSSLRATQKEIPTHLLGHHAVLVDRMLDEEMQKGLLKLLESKARIPSNSADLSFYKTKHEHIGEAEPISSNGTCQQTFLIPNSDRTLCILPGRIDIAMNYAMTGGYNGLKENLETLFSRLQSFGIYLFDIDTPEHSLIRDLFQSEQFLSAATSICPSDKQYLDPFQFNFIVQVPGQTVATHVDGVYFNGASRFQLPQWLLAVMNFSGLFQDRFVDQVQVVAYISDWDNKEVARNPSAFGEFVFWNETSRRDGTKLPPLSRSGNAIDGSKSIHTTTLYRPEVAPPFLDKNKRNELRFNQRTGKWDLYSDDNILATYSTQDLRISIVYRARCFASDTEADDFREHLTDENGKLSLEDILAQLVRKAEEITAEKAPENSKLDLALWLIKVFVVYPFPPRESAWIPYNFCALVRSPLPPFC